MRLAALFALLLAAYAGTIAIPARAGQRYADAEARHLLAAESILGRDAPRPSARDGLAMAALVAPAYALGGPRAAEWLMAAVAALAFVLAAALARRIVPEPWATGGAALVGLSPPALAAATTIGSGMAAGGLLAAAALCALACRQHARPGPAAAGALALAALPWLGPALVVPALPIAVALVAWTRRRRRGLGLMAAEIMLASLVVYVSVAPLRAAPALPGDYLDRVPNLIAVWLDRGQGLLRWAPVLVLAFYAGWLLYRSHRSQLARLAPERRGAEAAAALLVEVCAAQLLVATFWWSGLNGPWFPGAHFAPALPAAGALVAWGLRHAPRPLAIVLAALTLGASAWLVIRLRDGALEGWLHARTDAPWGPLARAFPDFAAEPRRAAAVTLAIAVLLGALALREWRARRALAAAA